VLFTRDKPIIFAYHGYPARLRDITKPLDYATLPSRTAPFSPRWHGLRVKHLANEVTQQDHQFIGVDRASRDEISRRPRRRQHLLLGAE